MFTATLAIECPIVTLVRDDNWRDLQGRLARTIGGHTGTLGEVCARLERVFGRYKPPEVL